jgi:hypothetical protein
MSAVGTERTVTQGKSHELPVAGGAHTIIHKLDDSVQSSTFCAVASRQATGVARQDDGKSEQLLAVLH